MEKMKEEAAVYDSGVMERFRKMSVYTLGSSKPDDKDWEELVLLIKKHLPQYYHALTSQHLLTPQELRTCLLLRLGFSASDIVVLMDVTPQRVTNIKTKANRKLFDEKGAGSLDSNLQAWMRRRFPARAVSVAYASASESIPTGRSRDMTIPTRADTLT